MYSVSYTHLDVYKRQPDSSLNIQRGGVVFIRSFGQASQSRVYLHAGALTKPQLVGVGIVDVTGQTASHIVEEDVAAPLDSGDHINVAAVADVYKRQVRAP